MGTLSHTYTHSMYICGTVFYNGVGVSLSFPVCILCECIGVKDFVR